MCLSKATLSRPRCFSLSCLFKEWQPDWMAWVSKVVEVTSYFFFRTLSGAVMSLFGKINALMFTLYGLLRQLLFRFLTPRQMSWPNGNSSFLFADYRDSLNPWTTQGFLLRWHLRTEPLSSIWIWTMVTSLSDLHLPSSPSHSPPVPLQYCSVECKHKLDYCYLKVTIRWYV